MAAKRLTESAPARAIMVQGTGSNVGKSLICAGLCRLFRSRGIKVAPFKPQNMANNAAVTIDGGEIGRAQALQAMAAGIPPTRDMNPLLLKPEGQRSAQIILQGERIDRLDARAFTLRKKEFLSPILESFARLQSHYDLVIIEGAGSPAETNLRRDDIANMGFARAANVPVVICADIDRGGVIASLIGTHKVLCDQDRDQIKGYFINRFRGDPELFTPAAHQISAETGWRDLGIVGWFDEASELPAEDSMALQHHARRGNNDGKRASERTSARAGAAANKITNIIVPQLPHIANFDDLDPLRSEPDIHLQILPLSQALPGDCDLLILPGSKSTMADLAALRAHGWHIDIAAHQRRGGAIFGLCGGFQMLGAAIEDPQGIESPIKNAKGLGLLEMTTRLTARKRLAQVSGVHIASGLPITGYEIHIGQSAGNALASPFIQLEENGQTRPEGAVSSCGRVMGSYIHGIFEADGFRRRFLNRNDDDNALPFKVRIEQILDRLAAHIGQGLNCDAFWDIADTNKSG